MTLYGLIKRSLQVEQKSSPGPDGAFGRLDFCFHLQI